MEFYNGQTYEKKRRLQAASYKLQEENLWIKETAWSLKLAANSFPIFAHAQKHTTGSY